uniref:(California timema) hypothetical protein n=1 Tax=Timema californicum TaxID=61474 RepID=A0A7R9P2S3_TIMCA|nr:unnamed protein product [Timema californicum]
MFLFPFLVVLLPPSLPQPQAGFESQHMVLLITYTSTNHSLPGHSRWNQGLQVFSIRNPRPVPKRRTQMEHPMKGHHDYSAENLTYQLQCNYCITEYVGLTTGTLTQLMNGSDLLASLTSTFDRKLKSLLNNNSSSATPEEASDDTLTTSTKKTSPVKSQVYRDPSLHRGSSPSLDGAKHAPLANALVVLSSTAEDGEIEVRISEKVEAVAKKAETPRRGWSREKDSVRQTKETSIPSQVSEQCNKTVGNKGSEKMVNTKENKLTKNETKSKCSLDEKKKGQPETKLKRSESLNKPEKLESPSNTKLRRSASLNKTERSESPSNTKLKRSDSLTKTEKTESNNSKRRQQEILSGSRGSNKEKDNITIIMTKLKRKNGMPERSIKRRHTVGGTKDFDKVNWLDNRFQHQLEDNEAAATNPIGGNKERRCMRASSPDLSSSRLSSILAQQGFRVEISLLGNGRVVAELTSPNGRPHSLPDANLASRVFKVPLESHV